MDRRAFIGTLALGALANALAGDAQERLWRIGHLSESSQPIPPRMEALRDLGWVEGWNITFIKRGSDQLDQLKDLAADLVRQKCDLIITSGSSATLAAKQATSDIPIVFGVGGDPVARGLVGGMSRPGGNLTGFALGIYDEAVAGAEVGAASYLARGLRGHWRTVFPTGCVSMPQGFSVYSSSQLASASSTWMISRSSSRLQSRPVPRPRSFPTLPGSILA